VHPGVASHGGGAAQGPRERKTFPRGSSWTQRGNLRRTEADREPRAVSSGTRTQQQREPYPAESTSGPRGTIDSQRMVEVGASEEVLGAGEAGAGSTGGGPAS